MIIDLKKSVEKYQLDLTTALHIGAHHGQEDTTYQQLGITPIYVEANPSVFEVLTANLPNRECHNTAIADRVGTVDFHVTSFDQSSSILPLKKHKEIYPTIVEEDVIQVPCTTIDGLLQTRQTKVDLINMDIQGAELLALQGAKATLPHVKCIMTEVNRAELYEGCGLIGDLDAYLKPFDFERVQSKFKYHRTWGDAFYVKSCYAKNHSWLSSLRRLFSPQRFSRSA